MKIAIVDDDKFALKAMQEFLAGIGHEILAVLVEEQTVQQVADEVNGFNPDFVILDHRLSDFEEKYGSDVAPLLHLAKNKLASSSTSGRQPYCGLVFEQKGYMNGGPYKERAQKELTALLAMVEQSI